MENGKETKGIKESRRPETIYAAYGKNNETRHGGRL